MREIKPINLAKANIIFHRFHNSKIPKFENDVNHQVRWLPILHKKKCMIFFETRGQDYFKFISKPHKSRTSCSRLSPYIAYGNLSMREVLSDASKIME